MRLRDRRTRIVLVVVLLLITLAVYLIGRHVWAGSQYRAAQEALARHDYREAGVRLDDYLSVRPTDPEALLLAAQTARRRGDFDQALRSLRDAANKGAPADGVALERQLLVVQSGNLKQAEELFRYCAAHPDRPETSLTLEALAEGCLRVQDVRSTRRVANLWLQHRTSSADQAHGLLWLGQADKLANDGGPAVANFQKAVELAPDHPFARILLVATLVHDKPEQARPHLDVLRRQRPDDPEVLFQTARMHRYLGQPEEAVAILDRLLAAGPNRVPALVERARAAMDLLHPGEAEHRLRKAVALAPLDRSAVVTLGERLRQLGKDDEARTYLDRVRAMDDRQNRQQPPGKNQP